MGGSAWEIPSPPHRMPWLEGSSDCFTDDCSEVPQPPGPEPPHHCGLWPWYITAPHGGPASSTQQSPPRSFVAATVDAGGTTSTCVVLSVQMQKLSAGRRRPESCSEGVEPPPESKLTWMEAERGAQGNVLLILWPVWVGTQRRCLASADRNSSSWHVQMMKCFLYLCAAPPTPQSW